MKTNKEMTDQVRQIFMRLFPDVKEVAKARLQDEVWYNYIKTKIDTLTLEEQEICLRYFFASNLEDTLIKFAKMLTLFSGNK